MSLCSDFIQIKLCNKNSFLFVFSSCKYCPGWSCYKRIPIRSNLNVSMFCLDYFLPNVI
uniref:N-carbamoylputrescine amidase n=1 Tax=Rhizophora mucronata TaxID=61149 RepID=A0A2P2LMW0_RHIMU